MALKWRIDSAREELKAAMADVVGGDLGRIKRRKDWGARMQQIIDKMQQIAEDQAKAARNRSKVTVTDEIVDQAFKLLDAELASFIEQLPQTEFMFVTDQAEIEKLKEVRANIQKGLESGTLTDSKHLGGGVSGSYVAKADGKKVIIKKKENLEGNTGIRKGWGIPPTADLYAEAAAQAIDELGGLFIGKAQATSKDVPDLTGTDPMSGDYALVMDWLKDGWVRKSLSRSKFGANATESDAVNWDLMQVYDALIGNTDRHGGNYLVAPVFDPAVPQTIDKDGNVIVMGVPDSSVPWVKFKIIPIDNGLSFPDAGAHRSAAWGNMPPWLDRSEGAGQPLNTRQLEVLTRLWKNRTELHRRLTALMSPGQVRGVFYRLIWMLESRKSMDEGTFQSAAYNPESNNNDGVVAGVLARGESVLNAQITNPDAIPVAPGQIELNLEP